VTLLKLPQTLLATLLKALQAQLLTARKLLLTVPKKWPAKAKKKLLLSNSQ
jgi:hypothetical protein